VAFGIEVIVQGGFEMRRRCCGLLLPTFIAFSVFFFGGLAKAEVECLDKSSPRECYEAGLKQVGAALGEFKQIETRLNSTINALKADNTKLQGQVAQLQQEMVAIKNTLTVLNGKLPGPADYYLKEIPSHKQDTEETCDNDDILVSAACTNANKAQAAVGPIFRIKNGKRSAFCARYGNIELNAEGQLICLKQK
jgi:hypothetical protein